MGPGFDPQHGERGKGVITVLKYLVAVCTFVAFVGKLHFRGLLCSFYRSYKADLVARSSSAFVNLRKAMAPAF